MSDDSLADTRTAAPAPMFSLNLRARDLVNVAIFAVIYLIVISAINMLGLISPPMMFLSLLMSVFASCIPFMLFLTRVKRAGMVTLFGVVVALFLGLIGLGWITFVIVVGLGILADVILGLGRYRSRWAAIGACTVFSLNSGAPFVPLMIDREGYLSAPTFQANGEQYVDAFDRLATLPVLYGFYAATLVCGFLGALLGTALLKKHFVRAGLA